MTRLITGLRHVGIAVENFDQAKEFYEKSWGLTCAETDSGVAFFSAEGSPENYVLRLRQGEKRMDLLAFAVASAADVDTLAAQLATSGIQLVSEPGTLDTPGGGYGFRFFDVDGRIVEVSADVAPRPYRALEEREWIPEKLSHVVLNSTDVAKTKAFYESFLGFRLSDWIGDVMCFLRTNEFHHTIAIARGPHASLNHVAFNLRGIDEYMRATGRLLRAGGELLCGPGRHMPGDNTFSYFMDPSRNVVEYTTQLELVEDEDTWQVRRFKRSDPESRDQWGTSGSPERLYPAMMNDLDTGLWTPCPL
ncbi:VOC family protein [Nocardioides sp. KR10-350]|uniref:VOC family protein n=1 Tax=Nocardioides cheoyonin TaxID=3156615 RepID=UPI0032B42193